MSAARQVLGGLLAVVLVGGAVVASTVMAFAELGGPAATAIPPSATLTAQPPASPTATTAATRTTVPPSPTRTFAPPTSTATPVPSDTATPSPTVDQATATLPPTATVAPATATPQPTICVPSPPAGWTTYIIQRGDTLFDLSVRFGVSQAKLQAVNCLANPSDIQAGQRIHVPRVATDTPPAPVATNPPAVTATIPADIPTITSMPVPSATPDCAPQEFFDPFLNRCRLPDG